MTPTRRTSSLRRRRRVARPLRSTGRRRGWSLRRRLAVLAAVLAVPVLVPAGRRAAAAAWAHVESGMAAARAAEAREREVVRFAFRYGIGPELAAAVYGAAEAEQVEPELAFRLVRVESGFRESAVSPAGALGLTQLMPATAHELQPGITREQIFERDTNLRLGFRYYRWLLRHYGGDVEAALHAYNRGPGTVDRIRAAGGDPANGYAGRVLGETGASPVGPPGTAAAAGPVHEMAPARLSGGR